MAQYGAENVASQVHILPYDESGNRLSGPNRRLDNVVRIEEAGRVRLVTYEIKRTDAAYRAAEYKYGQGRLQANIKYFGGEVRSTGHGFLHPGMSVKFDEFHPLNGNFVETTVEMPKPLVRAGTYKPGPSDRPKERQPATEKTKTGPRTRPSAPRRGRRGVASAAAAEEPARAATTKRNPKAKPKAAPAATSTEKPGFVSDPAGKPTAAQRGTMSLYTRKVWGAVVEETWTAAEPSGQSVTRRPRAQSTSEVTAKLAAAEKVAAAEAAADKKRAVVEATADEKAAKAETAATTDKGTATGRGAKGASTSRPLKIRARLANPALIVLGAYLQYRSDREQIERELGEMRTQLEQEVQRRTEEEMNKPANTRKFKLRPHDQYWFKITIGHHVYHDKRSASSLAAEAVTLDGLGIVDAPGPSGCGRGLSDPSGYRRCVEYKPIFDELTEGQHQVVSQRLGPESHGQSRKERLSFVSDYIVYGRRFPELTERANEAFRTYRLELAEHPEFHDLFTPKQLEGAQWENYFLSAARERATTSASRGLDDWEARP